MGIRYCASRDDELVVIIFCSVLYNVVGIRKYIVRLSKQLLCRWGWKIRYSESSCLVQNSFSFSTFGLTPLLVYIVLEVL